jgi:hypothetical protein
MVILELCFSSEKKTKTCKNGCEQKNTNRNCITSGKMCCGCWNCCWRILNNVNLLWVLSRKSIDVGNENLPSRGDRMCRRLWTNVNEKILNTPIDFQWDFAIFSRFQFKPLAVKLMSIFLFQWFLPWNLHPSINRRHSSSCKRTFSLTKNRSDHGSKSVLNEGGILKRA